jgi:hypothetical protein
MTIASAIIRHGSRNRNRGGLSRSPRFLAVERIVVPRLLGSEIELIRTGHSLSFGPMRFPMILLVLAGLCAGLPLALGQRGTNCVPTKAQVILREKMAELDAAKTPAPAAQTAQPTLPSEQEAKAREALQQKMAEKPAPAPTPTAAPPPAVKPAPVAPVAVAAAAPASAPQTTVATPVSRTGLTPDQEAKAREALRQQMEAMQPATPPAATVQTAPAPVSTPAPAPVVVAPAPQPAPAAAPVVVAPVVVAPAAAPRSTTTPPAVAATGLTPEQEAKARDALRQKMETLEPVTPPPAIVQTPPPPAPAPAPMPTPVPVVAAPAPQPAPVITSQPVELPALTASEEALAREALRRKMAELDAAMMVAEVESVPAPVPPAAPTPPSMAPVELPPSQKQGLERLAEITEQYRAGLMTPLAYHTERAKIVQSLR